MNPSTSSSSFAARFQGHPALWGAAAGSLAGIIIGLAVSITLVAQADNNRRTADVADGPLLLPYDGFLMLNNGAVDGEESLTFRLYGGPTCTDCELWNETQTVQLHSGRFSVGLGSTTALDALILDAEKLYLGIEVNGTPLSGRQAIEPVPYAAWSGHGTDFKTYQIATPGGTTSEVLDVQARLNVQGSQLALGTGDGRPMGANVEQLALLHSLSTDTLLINANSSFEGGTFVDSNLQVDGTLKSAGNVDIDGTEVRLGTGNKIFATSSGSSSFTINPGANAANGVIIGGPMGMGGDLTFNSGFKIRMLDTIEGTTSSGLNLKGRDTAPAVQISTVGGVSIPQNLSVTGSMTVGSVGADLRMGSSTEANRDITNVNSVHGDGVLDLYPADANSNGMRLDQNGKLTTSDLSTASIAITGSKTTATATNADFDVRGFFNENWADCGDQPVTGVRLVFTEAGLDKRARLQVTCAP